MFAAPLLLFYQYGVVSQVDNDDDDDDNKLCCVSSVVKDEEETPFCYVSPDPTMTSLYSVYNCASVSLQYLIPLLVISYSYVRVTIRLWWSVPPGHRSHSTVTQV